MNSGLITAYQSLLIQLNWVIGTVNLQLGYSRNVGVTLEAAQRYSMHSNQEEGEDRLGFNIPDTIPASTTPCRKHCL